FTATAPAAILPLSLHDALPIYDLSSPITALSRGHRPSKGRPIPFRYAISWAYVVAAAESPSLSAATIARCIFQMCPRPSASKSCLISNCLNWPRRSGARQHQNVAESRCSQVRLWPSRDLSFIAASIERVSEQAG